MRRVTTVLLILVGILLAGSYYVRASQQEKSKVARLSEQSPGPITFPKIDRRPRADDGGIRLLTELPKYDPDSDDPYQVNLQGNDLSKLDLGNSIDDLLYASFDDRTVWPASDKMPYDFDPQKIMELGKNPGLGVRRLHEEGITGRGVGVAILDQALLVDHQEYAERVRLYEEMDLQGRTKSAMHGAAVASIAVGKTVGVAPEAELYYIAKKGGTRYIAQGINRILEVNEQLPKDNKIRVISMSVGWVPSDEGYKDIMEAVQKAQAEGMLIVCSGSERVHEGFDFGALGRSPLADPDVFESFEPGLFRAKWFWVRPPSRSVRSSPSVYRFSVPMDSRTTASPTGIDQYVFYRIGGYSWAVPYIAGLYALAVQADPAITPERFWPLAMQTGRTIELERNGQRRSLGPIVDPVRLIRSIKTGETVREIQVKPKVHDNEDLQAYAYVPGWDFSADDLRLAGDKLDTLTFNQETVWPSSERLPEGFDPNFLLEASKNPGLGVRALHARGITGAGVHVGLIDQPLQPDHLEYDGKIVSYHVIDGGRHKSSMLGPAMASLLVGRHCGTAPGASLHVVAVPSWKGDAGYYARALDRFVAYNKSAPKEKKIRVVSVSAKPSGEGSVFKNQALWDQACARAEANGIMVLDCTKSRGFIKRGWYDPRAPESVSKFNPGLPPKRKFKVDPAEMNLYVPSSRRTTAQHFYIHGRNSYIYWGRGEQGCWAIPYCAGVLAMGWQIRPDLSPSQMKKLLFESAHIHESGAKIIHPTAFIDLIRKQSGNEYPRKRT